MFVQLLKMSKKKSSENQRKSMCIFVTHEVTMFENHSKSLIFTDFPSLICSNSY